MKRSFLFFALFVFCFSFLYSQDEKQNAKLPSVVVKTLDQKQINSNEFSNDGKPFVVCFWATWCKPCLAELSAMAELYSSLQEETGIKIYAVSIDDARTVSKVKPLINSRDWEFEVILDENSELRRAMGVNNPPHTFIIGSNGEILWQHVGYAVGDEEAMIEEYKKIAKEK
ncbi:MAG: TlpA family protein disulfide reductase [Bacteroidales bacterium]|jgi:alkyl hydroperoxide reductase subunit AhpC|nr:TlpA family protein disulfide reductase [Bacteroidales bacterium]